MEQPGKKNLTVAEEQGTLAKMGAALADWCERWFPDAYVFALIAVLVVGLGALAMGRSPMNIASDFGKAFWTLIPFTMQMAFVVIGGYIVAVAKPVQKLIIKLAEVPKTPKFAVAYVACLAMLASLLSWGFSLIFGGFLMREVARRVPNVDFRAISAAGYLGLGSVWALGLSSSAALLMVTKASIPPAMYKITGTIGLDQTLFTWQNLAMITVLVVMSCWICYASHPNPENTKTFAMAGISLQDPPAEENEKPKTPGEWLEFSPILTIMMVLIGVGYLIFIFSTKGFLAALDLNVYNFAFLIAGMLLHWTPRNFLRAAAKSIPATGGVLIQFPLYAGIFGMMMGSGLNDILAQFFVSVSNKDTLAPIVGAYSAILGLFLPSGGGKWIVEAPYIMQAANELKVNLAWMVQVYNAAEALPNFVNPFWMLPLMGLTGVKARDLAGYSTLQLIFHTPVVLFMLWLMAETLPYVPPMLQ